MKAEAGIDRRSALKALREERRESIAKARARVAAANEAFKKITTELTRGPRTVPEIALAVGIPTEETLWYVMALKKYGKVMEGTKTRGQSYYPYELIRGPEPEEAADGIDQ